MNKQGENKVELFYCPLARDFCKGGRVGIDSLKCLLWQDGKCLLLELIKKARRG